MIPVDDADVLLCRRAMDGRFLMFHRVDLAAAGTGLPWSGVMLDTGGDGHGLAVSLDPVSDAWAICDLLLVALERAKAEEERRFGPRAIEIVRHLSLALAVEGKRLGGLPVSRRIGFHPGPISSPYPWTVAARGPHLLPLCPDPEARDEGITPEQVLMVLDQALTDAVARSETRRWCGIARDHVLAALDGEQRLVAHLRTFP